MKTYCAYSALFLLTAAFTASGQTPAIMGVFNGADDSTRLCPGVNASVFGNNLGPSTAVSGNRGFTLSGVSVMVGGKPAFLSYFSATQLAVQLPFEAAAGVSTLTVTFGSATSVPFPITLTATAPALFSAYATQVAALSTTNSLINYGSPAHPNDSVTIYATGLGITSPATATGPPPASAVNNSLVVKPTLSLGGIAANIQSVGPSPGQPGVFQVVFSVPGGLQGTQQLILTSGMSNTGLGHTLAIYGITSVVSNGGFGSPGMAAPGEIASVFANGLGSKDQITGFPATTFQGFQVTFGGTAAPMFHLVASPGVQAMSAPQQIDLLVPQELPTSGTVNVNLVTSSATSPGYPLKMAAALPGLYRIQDPAKTSRFNVIAQFANTAWLALPTSTTTALKLPACTTDLSPLVVCGRPAAVGDYLVIYLTGLGITTPNGDPAGKPLATGAIPPADGSVLYQTPQLPTVTIGGIRTTVLYSGLAPGFPGEYQLDVQVPAGVASNDDVPLTVVMAGNTDTATISIQSRL